jgi:glycosyltransferase involved in cell wall biosynthesis
MRILYVWAESRTRLDSNGGDAVHVLETVQALRSLGHEVDLVSGADLRFTDQAKQAYRRARQLFPKVDLRIGQELYETLYDQRVGRQLAKRLSCGGYDGVYERYSLFHRCGVRAGQRHGLPVILEVNGTVREMMEYYGVRLKGWALRTERAALSMADAIVVVSEALRSELAGAGVPAEKIEILPNGVDEGLFCQNLDGEAVRRRYELGHRPVIGFVGSFAPWHDLGTLIQAFELVCKRYDARLLLVGDGEIRPWLEQEVRDRGLEGRVTFAGSVPHQTVPEYLAAMDVAVAPYPRIEPFHFSPMKVFEYMAAGRAVVTVALGEIDRLVAGGEWALFYEPGDAASLGRAIDVLLEDHTLRSRMGMRAREWVLRERSWSENARRIVEIFLRCCPLRDKAAPPHPASRLEQH